MKTFLSYIITIIALIGFWLFVLINFFIEHKKTIGKILIALMIIAVIYYLKSAPYKSEAKGGCLYDDLYIRSDCQDIY